jgi:hypothetical protein
MSLDNVVTGFGDEERARLRAALSTKESEYKAQVPSLSPPFRNVLPLLTTLCTQVAALQEHVRRATEREARTSSELAHVKADKQRLETLLQVGCRASAHDKAVVANICCRMRRTS